MSKNEKKIIKKNIICILLFAIVIVFVLLGFNRVESKQHLKYQSTKSSKTIKTVEQDYETKLDRNLQKKKFIGLYSIWNDKNVVGTKSYGVANSYLTSFSLETTIPVGAMQTLLNKYVLIELVKDRGIAFTKNISSYFPEVSNSKNITIQDVLNDTAILYVKPQKAHNISEKKAETYVSTHVSTVNSLSHDNRLLMNGQVMAALIAQISGNRYSEMMRKTFRKLKLHNAFFYHGQDLGAMDAVSYRKHIKRGQPQQDKINNESILTYIWGSNNLRMTLADVDTVYRVLWNDKQIFSDKAKKQYNQTSTVKIGKDKITILQNGFHVRIENYDQNDVRSVLLVSNYSGF